MQSVVELRVRRYRAKLTIEFRLGVLQHSSETLPCRGVGFKEGSLSLGPSVKVLLHVGTSLYILLIPHLESLLSILLLLVDAKDVPCAKRIDGLRLPEMILSTPGMLEFHTWTISWLIGEFCQQLLIPM